MDEGYGFVGHPVYQKVVPNGGDWSRSLPVQGKVHRLESPSQGLRGVMCPVGREREAGGVKACRRWGYLRRGANNPERRKPSPLGDQE